jgi:hypothetical protein
MCHLPSVLFVRELVSTRGITTPDEGNREKVEVRKC